MQNHNSKVKMILWGTLFAVTLIVVSPHVHAIQTELAGDVSNVGQYIAKVIEWSARLGVVAAVLVIVYAGNIMITSGGSPEGVTQAKEMIQGALLGVILIFLIVVFINFWVDLNQFTR